MTWRYVQSTGALDRDGQHEGVGYSGNTGGLNNPAMQNVIGVGPVPRGTYTIGPPHMPVDHLGPNALPLYPAAGNEMYGRSGFFIHGDNAAMDNTASDGCIILGPAIRQAIINSRDTALLVVSA